MEVAGPRTRTGRRRRTAPGGKALARLRQFEQERGLVESPVLESKADQLLARGAKPVKTRAKRTQEAYPYLAAFDELRSLAAEGEDTAMAVAQGWRPLGPYSIPHGQTYGSGPGSRPSVSGRVAAIAVDPANPKHILLGSAGGGVWETKDRGLNWKPRTDDQPSLAIGAVAFDPSNPAVAYAGTGEGNFYSRLGVGLLRSTDGGTTWSLHATAPFVSAGFYALIVDPLNGRHLLAATTAGIFESTDGASSWTLRRGTRAWDLSMHPAVPGDPASTREVFAACDDGVYRSVNGGTTWTAVTLPGVPAGGFQRAAVCHAPSDGDVVYAFVATAADTARMWRRSALGGPFAAAAVPGAVDTGQAWYDWFAAVAPNNPDVVYLGAIEAYKGVRSPTNTWKWTVISATAADSIHPDQHAIAFSPVNPNVVYIGNDGGIYRSPDAGTHWQSLNKNLSITEFEYLAQHPLYEAYLLAGTQDNGTLRYEGEEAWYHVQDGDGGDCGVNAGAPSTCFHTFYGMGMERSKTGGSWKSWTWVGPNVPQIYESLFYPPVEVNGNVIAQAGVDVFVSPNSGQSWTKVPLPQPGAGGNVGTALALPTPARIYVGTALGNVYRIDFAGGSWGAPVSLGAPRVGYVSDLEVDPSNPNRLWATYSDIAGAHVFRSDNGGAAWRNVSTNLPSIPVNAIVVDPAASDTVYAAADVGVYRSTDAGASWTAFNRLLPNALVADLAFFEPLRLLRAGTRNRGVWEIAVDAATMPDVQLYLRDSVLDTGRRTPSPSGVDDPFSVGARTYWWQSTDVKVDAPGYVMSELGGVDFELFDDDHGIGAAGLIHENPQPGKVARVYVQLHNRGSKPAANVAVKVFHADASVGLPDLPAGFWTSFPTGALAASSPWQPVAAHKVIPSVGVERGQIVGFEWHVPIAASPHQCLLAIATAADDPIGTAERNVSVLVTGNRKVALRNVSVVNPAPSVGARVAAVPLNVWRQQKWTTYELAIDRRSAAVVSGLVLSKRLSAAARVQGVKRAKPTAAQLAEVQKLVKQRPALKGQLDLTAVYTPAKGTWLRSITLDAKQPDHVVSLVAATPRPGLWSLIQSASDGTVAGGYTLQALPKP